MRPSRALIAASLFLAAAVALTGCTATPPAATAGSVTVIDVWLADYEFPHFLDPIRAQADRFGREHPGYQVKIEAFDYLTMPERIAAAGRAGKGPDVAQYYYTASQEARDTVGANGRPLFAPIGTEIAGRKEILGVPVVVDDLVPAARDYYSFGGVPFSMPKNVSTAVLYSNMEMLTAAGVTQPPQTWSELEADCAAIARTATHPPNCVTWANQGWFFQEAVGEQGGLLVDNDNGRSGRAEAVDLASPAMMAWVGWWKKLTDEGYYVYTGTQQDFIGTTQAFLSQQVAFTFNSSVPADFFVGVAAGSGFTAQVSRLPYNGDAPYAGNQVGGDSLFLAAGLDPKTRDGALAFMQYLDAPDNESLEPLKPSAASARRREVETVAD